MAADPGRALPPEPHRSTQEGAARLTLEILYPPGAGLGPGQALQVILAPQPRGKVLEVEILGQVGVELRRSLIQEIALPGRGSWKVEVQDPNFFAAPAEVDMTQSQECRIELLPAGWLEGSLGPRVGSATPPALALSLVQEIAALSATATDIRSRHLVACQIIREGPSFRCKVPAGRFEGRIEAEGFAPEILWGLKIEAGQVREIGEIELRKGSSLTGEVLLPPDFEGDVRAVKIELIPDLALDPTREALLRLRQGEDLEMLTRSTSADAQGRFGFTGLRAGSFFLEASLEGLASDRSEVFEAPARGVVEVPTPLELQSLATLDVFVEPPVAPQGDPWWVSLYDPNHREAVQPGLASPAGLFSRQGLEPGRYVLFVAERKAERVSTRWYAEELWIEPGYGSMQVEIPLLPFVATVRRGEEPVRALVWLGGRSGAVSLRFETDDEGRFEGFLPRAGLWKVDLAFEEGFEHQSVGPIQVEKPSQGGPAEIKIEIHPTRIAGRVLDSEGNSLPGSLVDAINFASREKVASVVAGPDGRFEILGVPSGELSLQARITGGESRWTSALLEPRGSTIVDLLVERQERFEARLLRGGEPIAGAEVVYRPEGGSRATLEFASTDGRGSFFVEVPTGSRTVAFRIQAPGYGLATIRAQLPPTPDQTFNLSLEPSPGKIEIAVPASEAARLGLALEREGIIFPFSAIHSFDMSSTWADQVRPEKNWQVLTLSAEPGNWSLCRREERPQSESPEAFRGTSQPTCANGWLAPGGFLVLNLPEPPDGDKLSEHP